MGFLREFGFYKNYEGGDGECLSFKKSSNLTASSFKESRSLGKDIINGAGRRGLLCCEDAGRSCFGTRGVRIEVGDYLRIVGSGIMALTNDIRKTCIQSLRPRLQVRAFFLWNARPYSLLRTQTKSGCLPPRQETRSSVRVLLLA